MTSQATQAAHTCACGCGTEIQPGSRWARGHFHRGEGTWSPLPGPEDVADLDELFPGEAAGVYGSTSVHPPGVDEDQADELGPDPAPAGLRDSAAGPRSSPARPKLTATLRRDINAKVSMPLEMGGQLWRARDPICGGTFLDQRPAIADALTDIICQSADLIEFFTGPAGGFMVYLKLAAALWPVVELVLGHHIFGHGHGQADEPAARQPDLSRYAA